VAKQVPGPWIRRPASILGLILATLLSPLVSPIALLLAFLADLFTRTPRFRRTRVVSLLTALTFVDFAGLVIVFSIWLVSPFGRRTRTEKDQSRYQRVMAWWTNKLIGAISAASPLPIDRSELDEQLLMGNAIVIGRHRSLLDAVLPAAIIGEVGVRTLYVLKEDLRWEPNIDIVGHRMGHVFVDRQAQGENDELKPIRELASRIDEESVGVIFPEGTFFNERRKARAVKALEKLNPTHAEMAQRMKYLLPPRPAGTLALLEAAPDADVVILGHVGFEPFGTIGQIMANLGAQHRVTVRAWRYPREALPTNNDELIDWLFERWAELDRWIGSHHPLAARPPVSADDQ